jgi:hypothetical protein
MFCFFCGVSGFFVLFFVRLRLFCLVRIHGDENTSDGTSDGGHCRDSDIVMSDSLIAGGAGANTLQTLLLVHGGSPVENFFRGGNVRGGSNGVQPPAVTTHMVTLGLALCVESIGERAPLNSLVGESEALVHKEERALLVCPVHAAAGIEVPLAAAGRALLNPGCNVSVNLDLHAPALAGRSVYDDTVRVVGNAPHGFLFGIATDCHADLVSEHGIAELKCSGRGCGLGNSGGVEDCGLPAVRLGCAAVEDCSEEFLAQYAISAVALLGLVGQLEHLVLNGQTGAGMDEVVIIINVKLLTVDGNVSVIVNGNEHFWERGLGGKETWERGFGFLGHSKSVLPKKSFNFFHHSIFGAVIGGAKT